MVTKKRIIMKTKIIPFNVETAKKIQAGEIKGCITTGNNAKVRIVCWDRKCYNDYPLVVLLSYEDSAEICSFYNEQGASIENCDKFNLTLKTQDTEPQFNPFDKVLVRLIDRSQWVPAFFRAYGTQGCFYTIDGGVYHQCIPYEGNEHLVGTTNKPKK